MAAKKLKKLAKPAAKKPAPRKLTKKAVVKPVKKLGKKHTPAAVARASQLKKPAPKAKAPVKKLSAPKKAAKKVIAAPKKLSKPAPVVVKKHEPSAAARKIMGMSAKKPTPVARASKPKAKPIKDPTKDYRNLRKYTHVKLAEIAENVVEIRATIKSAGGEAPLAAWELLDYLKGQEGLISEWKAKKLPPADGKPRKRGRPSKADLEARAAKPKVLQTKGQAVIALDKVKALGAKVAAATAARLPQPAAVTAELVPKLAPRPVSQAN